MAEKKVADYSASAEKLVNPSEVKGLLDSLHAQETIKANLEGNLKEQCAEIVDAIVKSGAVITQIDKEIREAIDQFGSYQDLEKGEYAVKIRRISKSYDAEKFTEFFEKFAPAVVIQTVNEKALDGLIKGKLITEEELKNCDVIKEDIKFAFYIR